MRSSRIAAKLAATAGSPVDVLDRHFPTTEETWGRRHHVSIGF